MGKIIKSIILSAFFLALAGTGTVWAEEVMPDLSMENAPADELSMDAEPQMSGRVDSTGIYFEVKDSEWLNVSVTSSELIKLTLESVPNMITLQVESAAGAASAQITIGGLAPDTAYHKYEDNYHNHEEFTTDDNGSYTYTQDLSVLHTVFIQTHKSTKFISDDGTGGDCYSIGIWDSSTKTCTLTMDLNETIQIDSDGITLEGNGHTSTGDKTGNGIYFFGRTGVSIKNLNIKLFASGISFRFSTNNSLTNNYVSNNSIGSYLYASNGNTIYGNTISNNRSTGIILSSSNNNILSNNTVSNNSSTGIRLNASSGNTLSGNNVSNNGYGIILNSSSSNTITGNNALNNTYGISIASSNNNILTGNSSSSNAYGISLFYSSYNTLSNNIMSDNSYNFSLSLRYDLPEFQNDVYYDNNIDTSNLVDGKPIYYIRNASDQIYDATTNAGVFYCISCNNVTIDGLTLKNNHTGMLLWKTQNSKIRNVVASSNVMGIWLSYSSGNTFEGNNVSFNGFGITLDYSSNNILKDNNLFSNGHGIEFRLSSNSNTVVGNTTDLTSYPGISFIWGWDCVNNIVYNNNFLATTRYTQRAIGPGNVFNLPAPIGGNYWINYDEPSEGCYDNNNDGFCDAPFGQDNLPWTKQDGWKPSDNVAPTTTASLSGTSGNNGWYLSDVQVTLTVADNEGGSRVAKTEYSFDGTNWVTYSAPFIVSAEGTTTVYYKSMDSAGNAETANSLTVSIDKTPPTIAGTATTSPNANGWHNTDVTVTFTCTDGTSGIAQCPSPITLSSEGAGQVVSGTAIDQAGNSATASVTLNIDKTLPVLTLSATPNILWPPNHEMVDVAIGGSATDTISHIASTEFVVTDEYGIVQPSITGFNTVIPLESWREGTDEDGRYYTITAVVTDAAGNKTTASATVLVPHDQGN